MRPASATRAIIVLAFSETSFPPAITSKAGATHDIGLPAAESPQVSRQQSTAFQIE
jgi:hypothetical protein